MDTFANYILNEKNLASKMEIVYYLSKKENIYFDKSVILKTELGRIFLKYNKLELDENLVLTASLLCNCKKVENVRKIEKRPVILLISFFYSQMSKSSRSCSSSETVSFDSSNSSIPFVSKKL